MKRYSIFIGAFIILLLSCSKEGLPGPQGPAGPAGEPGSGGSGGDVTIYTYFTPATAVFTWQQTSSSATNFRYNLKWTNATRNGTAFVLPDSLTSVIDEGVLLVYAESTNAFNISGKGWFQLSFMPVTFYPLEAYTCEVIKEQGHYAIKIIADQEGNPSDGAKPATFSRFKFVIIPKTETGELEWG